MLALLKKRMKIVSLKRSERVPPAIVFSLDRRISQAFIANVSHHGVKIWMVSMLSQKKKLKKLKEKVKRKSEKKKLWPKRCQGHNFFLYFLPNGNLE